MSKDKEKGVAGMRMRRRHQDDIRAKIVVSRIINRLMAHVEGEKDLSQTQVRAAEILLKKALPDLSAQELTGEDGGPIEAVIRWRSENT
jgi:ribosomal protein S7